jgi:hypothetical protein
MMKVQTFLYQIKELCYIEWLPGHEEKLTKSQLNLAFTMVAWIVAG